MANSKIKVLFTDLGGVLLTNGWDRNSRAVAVDKFKLDGKEFESRHQLLFADYEVGKIDLDTYLKYTVFTEPRDFSPKDFIKFMYAQSKPYHEMIDFVKELKLKHGIKVVVVSNEGKEITYHRIEKFDLKSFVDYFMVSCFMGIRKPDQQVYRLALNLVQEIPEDTIYLEDRQLFVDLARDLGIKAFHHIDSASTKIALENIF